MEKPEDDTSRDEIIDSYIKTLAMVVGSEEEARMKIYSVSTRYYYAFGALVSEELSYKINGLPRVQWVFPDSYMDTEKKDYGGEPFINGQAVPYDPKYHEAWLRNNSQTNNRNVRTPKSDKSRHSERKQNVQKQDSQTPMANPSTQNCGPNMAGVPPSNAEDALYMEMPSSKTGSCSNMGGVPNNSTNFEYSNRHDSGGRCYQNKETPGPGVNLEYQAGGNTYQAQDIPGSDVPPPH